MSGGEHGAPTEVPSVTLASAGTSAPRWMGENDDGRGCSVLPAATRVVVKRTVYTPVLRL